MRTSSIWGKCSKEEPRGPKGVRKEKLDGCSPLFTSPSPLPSYPLEENEGFGFPGSKALLNGTYQLHQEGAVGTDRFLPHYSSLLLETRASPEKAPGQEEWVVVAAGLKVELSLKLLPSALRPCLPSKPAHQPPQVHPVTPYLGVTPDEAQLPTGPPAHRGGHIWAVPSPVGSAIWGADFGSGSPWGVGPGLGSFPRGPSYPFLSSSFPIAVNISTKWKRKKKTKKKKKRKKISSLEATGSLWPSQPGAFSGAEWRHRALAARTSPCMCASPAGVGGPPEQLFTIQRQKTKSRSNSETKNLFPSRHRLSPLSLLRLFPGISQPSWGVYLTACPRTGACLPLPSPLAQGRHPYTQRCFCQDGCAVPLSSCFLYIASGTLWVWRKGLISHLERMMGEEK
ncbi:uncharacterized protein LOC125083573 [Lutra lutra]|uniref:uncharacterized protein LOC125083573 n=1 Tax=Lutra lutra TaxID=9657 RepID=UPI001FD5F195|nr:uncharacterized protein LOC125083573 [Lutra lutra]